MDSPLPWKPRVQHHVHDPSKRGLILIHVTAPPQVPSGSFHSCIPTKILHLYLTFLHFCSSWTRVYDILPEDIRALLLASRVYLAMHKPERKILQVRVLEK